MSETTMLQEVETLLDYIKEAYGMGCTLQRETEFKWDVKEDSDSGDRSAAPPARRRRFPKWPDRSPPTDTPSDTPRRTETRGSYTRTPLLRALSS